MAKGRKAWQRRAEEGRKICCWREAMTGWQGQQGEGGSVKKGEGMKRDEKQGTYFPVYPNLRDAKRLNREEGAEKRERKKESRGGNKS